ncbi:hypothetical protein C4J81_06390 [Deltaproteobacteria bacterium Smac51]|nr:hypothetical protein C4J81_06390 [Deltaproteobacteria bacterium Smac51]
MMGTLFWIDNSWALIFDDDPYTQINISSYYDLDGNDDSRAELEADDDGIVPVTGGILVQGNGDQDDNRDEPFSITKRPSRVVSVKSTSIYSDFRERRMVKAYRDFGHLKVMPGSFKFIHYCNLLADCPRIAG